MSKDGTRPLAGQIGQDNDPYGIATPTDSQRLDWVEANAKEHREDTEAQVAVQHHLGGIIGMEETGFYFRQWGAAPIDEEGIPDYSHRFYRSTRYETLRAAIDAAIAAAPGRADD